MVWQVASLVPSTMSAVLKVLVKVPEVAMSNDISEMDLAASVMPLQGVAIKF